jgi:class 3 adenylate cyclase
MAQSQSLICKGCWQNLHIPMVLRGPLSVPFRVVGLKPSRMNPNTCTFCELMFSRVMKATKITIDATILFADLRAYTRLSQEISPAEMGSLLDLFYDECAAAIWDHDGLLNKTIGDAVMAVFNFPIKQDDHARQALLTAREIQQRLDARKKEAGLEFGVGIGLQSGEVSFGEFGRSHRDLTAIGTVVNTAARVQAVAEPGEILVTEAMRERVGDALGDSVAKPYELKGFDKPIMLYRA